MDDVVENSIFAQNTLQNCGSSEPFIYDAFKSGIFLSGKLSNIQFICNAINDKIGIQNVKQIFANYSHNVGNCIAYNSISNVAAVPLFSNSPESSGVSWITTQNKPALSFDSDSLILKEGAVNTSLNVMLSEVSNTTVNADIFVLDNTAKIGKDFTVSKNTITFLPGQTSKAITINALGNARKAQGMNATLVIKYDANVLAGCRQYAKLILELPVKADSSKQSEASILRVHPNPASRKVTISLAGFEGESAVQVRMTDMAGKLFVSRQVRSGEGVKQITLPVRHLPHGLFLVTLRGSKTIKTAKLVITK